MKKIITILIIFLLMSPCAKAETLSFKSVLEKAVKNSYDLKLSQIDIKIAETEIKEAKAEYLPIISAGYNAQYNKDLTNGTSSMTSVGESIVTNSTNYQNALSAALQYNIFDFGIRKNKLSIAKADKNQKTVGYNKNLRNLKLGLADSYTKALLASKELKSNEELLAVNKNLFSMYENLYNAGTARKTDMADQALQVAVLINKIDDLKTETKNSLSDISFYTKENYTTSAKILNLFEDEEGIVPVKNEKAPIKLEIEKTETLNIENLPEYKEYQLEIEKKKAELSVLKRQNLPAFKFYTNYYFYGTDQDHFSKTFGDMQNRSLTFRISSTLPVFDGMKNKALRERAKLEIERLNLERDKKVESVKTYYEKIYEESKDMPEKLKNQENALKLTEEKIEMIEKLNQQKLIDKISYLKQKSNLITQKFQLEKTKINNEAAAYKVRILTENAVEEPVKQNTSKKKPQNPH